MSHVSTCSVSRVLRRTSGRAVVRGSACPQGGRSWGPSLHGQGACTGLQPLCKAVWQFLQLSVSLKSDPSVLLRGVAPQEMKAPVPTEMCVRTVTTTLRVPVRMCVHRAVRAYPEWKGLSCC